MIVQRQSVQTKMIADIVCQGKINSIKTSQDKLIIALDRRVILLQFNGLTILDVVQTCYNPSGILALGQTKDKMILATPSIHTGNVTYTLYGQKNQTRSLKGNSSHINSMQLSPSGLKLAVVYQKGKIIRIYDLKSEEMIQQLRRGLDQVQVQSLFFSDSNRWMGMTCSSGTLHIFAIKPVKGQLETQIIQNTKSKFFFMSYFVQYFDAEWSFAKFHSSQQDSKGIFIQDDKIILMSREGKFRQLQLKIKQKELILINQWNILS